MNQNNWLELITGVSNTLKNGAKVNVVVGIDTPTSGRLFLVGFGLIIIYLVLRIYVFPKTN